MTSNNTLQRNVIHRGRPVLAMDGVFAGAPRASCPAAQLDCWKAMKVSREVTRSSFSFLGAAVYGVGVATLCLAAQMNGESPWWWLTVPVAVLVGGFGTAGQDETRPRRGGSGGYHWTFIVPRGENTAAARLGCGNGLAFEASLSLVQ